MPAPLFALKITGSGTNTVTSANVDTISGLTWVIGYSMASGRSPNAPTDNKGNSFPILGTVVHPTGGGEQSWYICQNANGGAGHNFTATWGTSTDPTVTVCGYDSVLSASLDAASAAENGDTSSPFTVTSGTFAQANNTVVSICGAHDGTSNPATHSESSGFTIAVQETDESLYWTAAQGWRDVTDTAPVTPSWTALGDTVGSVHVVGLKQSGGGGVGQPMMGQACL